MKKIGIVTHYFRNMNYGGELQAYALTKALGKLGYDAEQICFNFWAWNELTENVIKSAKDNKLSFQPPEFTSDPRFLLELDGKYDMQKESPYCIQKPFYKNREQAFLKFAAKVPHSDKAYTVNTLFQTNEIYDAFITGSDQVWNLKWHNPAFFLDFADDCKKKIAYAASAGSSVFDNVQKQYLARTLPKLDAISVREKNLVDTYKEIAGVDAQYVLDPVLLLDTKEWDAVASERLADEKYMFCFFYGPTKEVYRLAEEYAEKHGLKIALIPDAFGYTTAHTDDDFGDCRFPEASPEDFISLIKYADCIFTDSFHAMAFSLLYGRSVFGFGRDWNSDKLNTDMSSRIYSLFDLFDCKERFCDRIEKLSPSYIDSVAEKTLSGGAKKYWQMLEKSVDFLKRSLEE